MSASYASIPAEMCLKPTGTSTHFSPNRSATRSSRWVVAMLRTAAPRQPLYLSR